MVPTAPFGKPSGWHGDGLEAILQSEVYGRGVAEREAAPITRGVYLFTERRRHVYVGRTGNTERSVRGPGSCWRAAFARGSLVTAGPSSARRQSIHVDRPQPATSRASASSPSA